MKVKKTAKTTIKKKNKKGSKKSEEPEVKVLNVDGLIGAERWLAGADEIHDAAERP